MKVLIDTQGPVTLHQKDYLASGGEGSIYVKGNTALKLYTDPKRMLPLGKIAELSVLQQPNIIKPELVIRDEKTQDPIGYTMRFVSSTMPLCALFTRAYREREGLTHNKMLQLVQQLQAVVKHVHEKGLLIVDLNEMNFLAAKDHSELYAIDVDSYQTRTYPATALMPSVRDWQVKGHNFSENSDWFSFACVAFQMFVGIHPYKGKHPAISGLEDRMKANVSVFDDAVSLPKVVYPFTTIPSGYLEWFKAVLRDGKRVEPPQNPGHFSLPTLVLRPVVSSDTLVIQTLFAANDLIQWFAHIGEHHIWQTQKGLTLDQQPVLASNQETTVIASPQGSLLALQRAPTGATQPSGYTHLTARILSGPHKTLSGASLLCKDLFVYQGRIYLQTATDIQEVTLSEGAQHILLHGQRVAQISEHSSRFFSGVCVQDLLGKTVVSTFPHAKHHCQTFLPTLDRKAILSARFDTGVLMVTTRETTGKLTRHLFVLDPQDGRVIRQESRADVGTTDLNFVTLDNGYYVHLTEAEEIEAVQIATGKIKIVRSSALSADMRLVKYKGRVACIHGQNILSLQMR